MNINATGSIDFSKPLLQLCIPAHNQTSESEKNSRMATMKLLLELIAQQTTRSDEKDEYMRELQKMNS